VFFNEKIDLCYPCVLFLSFDFNFIVDLRCGVSVFYGRWFSSVFLAIPVLVSPKGSVARSFFASDFICRATPSRTQDSGFPSRDFDLSSFAASVCRSPFSLDAPPGTTGPRPRAGAISRPTSLARTAPISSSRDLLCRSPNAPGFPLVLLAPGLCPINPSLSAGLPALIQFPLE
jgi:hypothetical protein